MKLTNTSVFLAVSMLALLRPAAGAARFLGPPVRVPPEPPTTAPAEAQPPPVPAPTTAPAAGEVDRLIAQLSDPDPTVREAATLRLRQIGKPALPALKEAVKDGDPELRSRGETLIRRIERPPLPGGPVNREMGPLFAQAVRVTVRDGVSTTEVSEGGRKVRIVKSGDAIEMTVTGMLDGRMATQSYKAANAEQLKEDNPEAYALYERWSNVVKNWGVNAQVFGGVAGVVVDPLDLVRDRLIEQMRKAGVPADQRAQVLELLQRLQNARFPVANMADPERDRRLADLFKRGDELRQKLAELKLPDPKDEVLPPPAKARLGVQLRPVDDNSGLVVERVAPDSRAQKLGLKAGDSIEKINGKAVATVEQLRQELAGAEKQLVLEGQRDGAPLKLVEKR